MLSCDCQSVPKHKRQRESGRGSDGCLLHETTSRAGGGDPNVPDIAGWAKLGGSIARICSKQLPRRFVPVFPRRRERAGGRSVRTSRSEIFVGDARLALSHSRTRHHRALANSPVPGCHTLCPRAFRSPSSRPRSPLAALPSALAVPPRPPLGPRPPPLGEEVSSWGRLESPSRRARYLVCVPEKGFPLAKSICGCSSKSRFPVISRGGDVRRRVESGCPYRHVCC